MTDIVGGSWGYPGRGPLPRSRVGEPSVVDAILRTYLSDLVRRGLRVDARHDFTSGDTLFHVRGPRHEQVVRITSQQIEATAGAGNRDNFVRLVVDMIRAAAPSVLIPYREGKWRKFGASKRTASCARRMWRGERSKGNDNHQAM